MTKFTKCMSEMFRGVIFAENKNPVGRSTTSPRACNFENSKIVSMAEIPKNYPTMKFRLRNMLFGGLRSKTCATKCTKYTKPTIHVI
jgi:hypothetical protein